MSNTPRIIEQSVRAYVGGENLQRGWLYINNNAVSERYRRDRTLKARCKEVQSGGEDKFCLVTFDAKGITNSYCTAGETGSDEGHCEHIAALLLAWMEQPETFTEQEPLQETLDHYEKPDLIGFLRQLVLFHPALEVQLDALLAATGPSAAQKKRVTVNRELYQRQVAHLFDRDVHAWGAYYEIAKEALLIKEVGDDFFEQDDCANAAAIYTIIATTIIDNYYQSLDATDKLSGVIRACAEDLIKCLAEVRDDKEVRAEILKALLAIYELFLSFGWGDVLVEDISKGVLRLATTEEKQVVAKWIREQEVGQEDDEEDDEGYEDEEDEDYENVDDFLFDLEADQLDDETYLRHYRELKRTDMVVDRLLKRGHVDEALKEVASTIQYEQDLIEVADVFILHKYDAEAERLVREHFKGLKGDRTLEWLKDYYDEHNDMQSALQMAGELFSKQKTFENYQEARRFAEPLGRWDTLKRDLLETLNKDKVRNAKLLIQVALDDERVDDALDLLNLVRSSKSSNDYLYGIGLDLELQVAEAAEGPRPRAAIEIYVPRAEAWIDLRGRDNYAAAARLLTRVRGLYDKTGERNVWMEYIAALKEKNRRLPALQDELRKAKL